MNFSYGVIGIVGVLAAISIGFIAMDPGDIIEPRLVSTEENVTVCTMEWNPMCGVDGETYGNMCMLNSADAKLDYQGECVVQEPEPTSESESTSSPELVACTMEWNPMCGVDGETYGNPCGLDAAGIELDYEGECMIPESTETAQLPIASGIHQVNLAEGSGAPGCEETDECFLPYFITISTGETVVWNNIDSAAHTVTSGNVADGHDGMFDSSLFMSGLTFDFTFNEAGSFDYFCMVHPWMTGKVIVNDIEDMVVIEEPEPELTTPEQTSESLPMTAIVSIPVGVAVPGCEGTNECYLPYEITVAKGATVSWMNADSAAHTVSSGTVEEGLSGVFDSSLFMAGAFYEFTFNEAGTYDYFCMVHPWMTGIVNVN